MDDFNSVAIRHDVCVTHADSLGAKRISPKERRCKITRLNHVVLSLIYQSGTQWTWNKGRDFFFFFLRVHTITSIRLHRNTTIVEQAPEHYTRRTLFPGEIWFNYMGKSQIFMTKMHILSVNLVMILYLGFQSTKRPALARRFQWLFLQHVVPVQRGTTMHVTTKGFLQSLQVGSWRQQ